jgi:hypothetical protein
VPLRKPHGRGYRFLGAIQTAQVSSKPNGYIDSIAVFPLLNAAMQKAVQLSQRAPIFVSLLGEAYAEVRAHGFSSLC